MHKLFLALFILTSSFSFASPSQRPAPQTEEEQKKAQEAKSSDEVAESNAFEYNLYDRMENKRDQQQREQYYYYQNDDGSNSAPQYNRQQQHQHNREDRSLYFDVRNE